LILSQYFWFIYQIFWFFFKNIDYFVFQHKALMANGISRLPNQPNAWSQTPEQIFE